MARAARQMIRRYSGEPDALIRPHVVMPLYAAALQRPVRQADVSLNAARRLLGVIGRLRGVGG